MCGDHRAGSARLREHIGAPAPKAVATRPRSGRRGRRCRGRDRLVGRLLERRRCLSGADADRSRRSASRKRHASRRLDPEPRCERHRCRFEPRCRRRQGHVLVGAGDHPRHDRLHRDGGPPPRRRCRSAAHERVRRVTGGAPGHRRSRAHVRTRGPGRAGDSHDRPVRDQDRFAAPGAPGSDTSGPTPAGPGTAPSFSGSSSDRQRIGGVIATDPPGQSVRVAAAGHTVAPGTAARSRPSHTRKGTAARL